MGTHVITRDTGRRLGVVGEVVVDIDRREVVALGLRDNPLTRYLPGLPRWMPLDRIRQVGDVILVDSSDSLKEGFTPDRYSRVINCQVITESGQQLGRVLGFSFDFETGELTTLVIGAIGVPLLGEGVLSTWEMPVDEVVSSGADRIIVYEGAEEKLKQLNSGFLEKLGVGGPSWEEQERERYRMNLVPVENQLNSGPPTEQEQRRLQPSTTQTFEPEEELEYVELEERQQEVIPQQRYLDETPSSSPTRYRNDREERMTFEEPPAYEQRPVFEESAAYEPRRTFEEQQPQRPRPASRRPVQSLGDPLDVEPLDFSGRDQAGRDRDAEVEEPPPRRNCNELDDPW